MKNLFLLALGYGLSVHGCYQEFQPRHARFSKEFETACGVFNLKKMIEIQSSQLDYLKSHEFVVCHYNEVKNNENPDDYIRRFGITLELLRLQKKYYQTWKFSEKRKNIKHEMIQLSAQTSCVKDFANSKEFDARMRTLKRMLTDTSDDFIARQEKLLEDFVRYHQYQKELKCNKMLCDSFDVFA